MQVLFFENSRSILFEFNPGIGSMIVGGIFLIRFLQPIIQIAFTMTIELRFIFVDTQIFHNVVSIQRIFYIGRYRFQYPKKIKRQ